MEYIDKLQTLFQRLEEFKSDQNEYWEEVKQISDEAEDHNNLPIIYEEECNSSEALTLINQTLTLVNHLREGEIKIVERYKYELKQLALEMKEMSNKNNRCSQTQTEIDPYESLYFHERQRYAQLEKKFEGLKRMDESSFKQEVQIELASLKNKIQILTESSTEAETLLIKKDQQVKDYQKQVSKIQKELTQKRGELSGLQDLLKTKEVNLQMAQNMNKNYEIEIQKLNKLRGNSGSVNKRQQPHKCYETLALEIQELAHTNQQLKQQLFQMQKKVKELAQELCDKDKQLVEVLAQIDEIKLHMQVNNKDEELKEAMDYLEMKDLEIERLHREIDSYRRGYKENTQIKDLQNLLLVMSRNLQEKEQQLLKFQQQY